MHQWNRNYSSWNLFTSFFLSKVFSSWKENSNIAIFVRKTGQIIKEKKNQSQIPILKWFINLSTKFEWKNHIKTRGNLCIRNQIGPKNGFQQEPSMGCPINDKRPSMGLMGQTKWSQHTISLNPNINFKYIFSIPFIIYSFKLEIYISRIKLERPKLTYQSRNLYNQISFL